MRQPLVVLVSGAPGSGKTTLAHTISRHLRLPHVPRDEILRSLEMTQGGPIIDKGGYGIGTYYTLLSRMLELGMSFVTDGTIYKGISEKDIATFLISRATVVNIHARATDEHERFLRRELQRENEGWSSDWVHTHLGHLEEIYSQTAEPLDLNVPLIEVDATGEYNPHIHEIIAEIRRVYIDTRPGQVLLTKQGEE